MVWYVPWNKGGGGGVSVRDVVCCLVCSMEHGGLLGMLSVVWYVPWSMGVC